MLDAQVARRPVLAHAAAFVRDGFARIGTLDVGPGNRVGLLSDRFPRSSQYHPDWVLANVSGGANALWSPGILEFEGSTGLCIASWREARERRVHVMRKVIESSRTGN